MDIKEQLRYIIEKIKVIRIKNGVSQMELSLRSNLSQSFIANLEKGKKQPSVFTLIRIAEALNVNPQEFFPEPIDSSTKEQIKEKIRKLLELL
ncbi:MAG: helix-turn-helix domain-containing protein [Treponema sp.]|nr:helix-turn-helix domain-containing protein [Treponema sp.]